MGRQPDGHNIFFADAMLGKLARWLRILGYDTAYEKHIPDTDLIERVIQEGRWLLTRDRYLAKRRVLKERLTLLRSDFVGDQLRQLMVEHDLDLVFDVGTLSRCAECNLLLNSIPREQAASGVPPYVASTQTRFWKCSGCGQIYWPGTHVERIRLYLRHLKGRLE